eukprot:CAMPEP_0170731454 /NCGR_PEP_ID=MMETSP0437-20130122/1052_1 /TAXON_ID=0 /ORGANISM="Sexangularia sp." /LENGTH=381 /DNA_ID=CAMNT_0011069675 /DNA_START=63 /DNA_END=1204 /DNA_ORIENTATION=+
MSTPHDSVLAHMDSLGPESVSYFHEPRLGLVAFLAIDNSASGMSLGGIRMSHDVDVLDVLRLARKMTLKNALFRLPHGGAKAGIRADPRMPTERKEALIRSFARSITQVPNFVPGPDMGMDETAMAWIRDEVGRGVGMPRVMGGLASSESGATGFGLTQAAKVAADFVPEKSRKTFANGLKGVRVAVQGFGKVGQSVAQVMEAEGAIVVAVSDTGGGIYAEDGIDVNAAIASKLMSGTVSTYTGNNANPIPVDTGIIGCACDLLVPAARHDAVNDGNWRSIQAKLVVPAANSPFDSIETEKRLHEAGILVVPDFVANAGGVICAALEHTGWMGGGSDRQLLEDVETRIVENASLVLRTARETGMLPRQAATQIATQRVEQA